MKNSDMNKSKSLSVFSLNYGFIFFFNINLHIFFLNFLIFSLDYILIFLDLFQSPFLFVV